jgi:DNA-binding NtrC family response regulator
MKQKLLVVEDDLSLRNLIEEIVSNEDLITVGVGTAEEAINRINREKFDIILTDVNLPGQSGLELIPLGLQQNPNTYIIVITGFGTIDVAVWAMKQGAADFLSKPVSLKDIQSAVRIAIQKTKISSEETREKKTKSKDIVAESEKMLDLMRQVKIVAPYKASVLITGETGTGKELIAREIHKQSERRNEPFVALNCAAIPEQLLEDELFGHVKGAYTGANQQREGRFEQANKGTLFLDEIGDMNLALQAKLLRVLQEREFEKVGSSRTIKVDVRVVAATSADLRKKITDGSFRADLYHRLNVVKLNIPPLRERPADILPLAEFLLSKFCESAGLPLKELDETVEETLKEYDFPGNVRQLQNCMERAAIFSGVDNKIRLENLPEEIRNLRVNKAFDEVSGSESNLTRQIPDEGLDFSQVVSQLERELLLQTLDKTGGNKMQAAKLLKMKRTTLVEKLKRLQIDFGEEDDENLKAVNS